MILLVKMLIFAILGAFIVAKLEINIEGKDGWAKNLPTWKVKNSYTKLFLGEVPLTGYHFWLFLTVLTLLQFGFVIGIPWSLSLELKIIAMFFVSVIFEDFFWFVLNPAYGIKKLNKVDAYWHTQWVHRIPALYVNYASLIAILLLLSYFIK
jgi:hypothetical protein